MTWILKQLFRRIQKLDVHCSDTDLSYGNMLPIGLGCFEC